MSKFKNFMTEKEKRYVSDFFQRNMHNAQSSKNFAHIFSNSKDKAVIAERKENKRSYRTQRSYASTTLPSDVGLRYSLESLMGLVLQQKYFQLPGNSNNDKQVIEMLEGNFEEYVKMNKFYAVLTDVFLYESAEVKNVVFDLVLKNINNFDRLDLFNEFVNNSFCRFDLSSNRVTHDVVMKLTGSSPGIILATGLLIREGSLSKPFFDSFMSLPMDNTSFIWPFLAVLVSYLDEKRTMEVVTRVQHKVIADAKEYSNEDLKRFCYFLKAIGVELNDIIDQGY